MEQPLNASVHFFFINEFAPLNLVDSNLHLRLELLVVGKKSGNGFLHQFVGSSPGLGRKLVKLGFLSIGQMYFHAVSVVQFAGNAQYSRR